MKKFLSLFMCLGLCIGLVGCSGDAETSKSDDSKTEENEKEENESINIDSFEKLLKNNGYEITEKVQMDATLIGGIEGTKFKTDKGNIEIYKFDTNSEGYKKVVNEGKVTLEGFGDFDAIYKNEFVILNADEQFKNILNTL